MTKKHAPHFIDTTLRDGEQAPGVAFTLAEKMAICHLLDRTGITEVEIGTPAMGDKEINEIRYLCSSGFGFITTAWCRATPDDIMAASRCGTDGVHISFPVSDILLKCMQKDQRWVIDSVKNLLSMALELFSFVTVGAQDASRCEASFLNEFVSIAKDCGAARIRMADTVGTLTPKQTARQLSNIVKNNPGVPFEFHAHNDLGMATANILSAFDAGVQSFSVTVNGLGERAGNAALEEVVMAFEVGEQIPCGLDTTMFYQLSEMVAKTSNRPIHPAKPITGKMVLAHESGIHTASIIRDRNSYQLINAESIGREDIPFVFGKHSGKTSIYHFFNNLQIEISEDFCNEILNRLKEQSEQFKEAISEIELMDIYNQLLHEKSDSLTENPVVLMRTSLNQIEEDWVKY
ncbi:homocitrate synthase/isopropylmalate synthase family protein [Alkalitalea saponilacus]|uniref:Homocitrate synthase NifV n=1 Tax=Alkalitalea saponilacus TaxID=889453 RepID=A0A1T5GP24_9BACT|nr:pyruvate carboxyltransferase [Alkalitalea saponilacus]ASB48244.1 pyruvate carboxyltransferase [Alkalitalea saponilacus]SKC10175.1 homocitrate synthase NifV [Alkalitalea saponilacus]